MMTDPSDLVERPGRYTSEAYAAIEQLQAVGFDFAEADMIYHGDMLGRRLGAKASQALISLQAERDEARAWVAKLQAALMFWMPGVTEATDTGLERSAGDDAFLLAGFDGQFPATCWGDDLTARLSAAEAEIGRMREALEPFAKLAEAMAENTKPDDWISWGYNDADLLYGDFRRARAALQPTGKTP